ncbi:MAG: response regulator [Pseudobdellovibrionaceae bacterium]
MKKKILIVDDEPLVRRSLKRVLEPEFEVIEGKDGSEGLDLWKKHAPELVFLDVLMPGLTGLQVLNEMKVLGLLNAKVILISAYSGEEDTQSSGADLFLQKPFDDIFSVKDQARRLLSR